ncbi:MAG: hypothetical protein QM718_11065 [Steroidobacteraceae bacterium]
MKTQKLIYAVIGSTLLASGALASETLAVGPVEGIDAAHGVIYVLGQSIDMPATGVDVGDYVQIDGELATDGSYYGTALTKLSDSYAAGADRVYLRGLVTSNATGYAYLRLGSASIDYSPTLSEEDYSAVTAGDVVEISGTQPIAGGVILAVRGDSASIIRQGSSGFGVAREGSSGFGVAREGSSGFGVAREGSSGFGVAREGSSGFGVAREGSSGFGVAREGSSGFGVAREGSSGFGVAREGSSGFGVAREGSSGFGVAREGSSGFGVAREGSSGFGSN